VEVEAAERARIQSAWILIGALDWSRLILIEDSRAGGATTWPSPGPCRWKRRACPPFWRQTAT
jgi:hypothetical protein